jgi:hypothetical protein
MDLRQRDSDSNACSKNKETLPDRRVTTNPKNSELMMGPAARGEMVVTLNAPVLR